MEPSGLSYLVYCSAARRTLEERELQTILATSRRNNAVRDITGVLLYGDGCFLQVLEGPSMALSAVFDRIANDPRHTRIEKMVSGMLARRHFGEWSMGYRPLDGDSLGSIPGFSTLMQAESPLPESWSGHPVYTLLKSFRDRGR